MGGIWRMGKFQVARGRASTPIPKRKWGRHCCRPHYRLRRFRPMTALSLPDFMPGRCDAYRDTASAMGTGGASHRDARRIGPCNGSNSSVRFNLATSANRLPSASMTAPTSGPVRRSEVLPKDRFFPPGGSNGRFQASPSGRSPCRPRSHLASVRSLCSAPCRSCDLLRVFHRHLSASVRRFCSAFRWSCDLLQAFLAHLSATWAYR